MVAARSLGQAVYRPRQATQVWPACSSTLTSCRVHPSPSRAQMLELLNMKGKHKHKWDYLREVLAERVVYDDMLHRLWYTDESMTQGVLFACKQGQVNMERPIGERVRHRAA